MSTNETAVAKGRAETAASDRPSPTSAWRQVARRTFESLDFTKLSSSRGFGPDSCVVVSASPKAIEVARQIGRLRQAKEFAESTGQLYDSDALISSIQFLENLYTSPIPVPVASWDAEGGASLFFYQGGFYGDIEVSGKKVEYFLKWSDQQDEREVYDSEEIEEGRIPPRLLIHLFGNFARSNADVP